MLQAHITVLCVPPFLTHAAERNHGGVRPHYSNPTPKLMAAASKWIRFVGYAECPAHRAESQPLRSDDSTLGRNALVVSARAATW